MVMSDGELQPLPGSRRMVTGELVCHHIELDPPLQIGEWCFHEVYAHVAYEASRPLSGAESVALTEALDRMTHDEQTAKGVLLEGKHAYGQPLPGVYTVDTAHESLNRITRFRVDLRAYFDEDVQNRHLWAELIKR